MRFEWYRVEVAVFRRRADAPVGAARARLRDAFRLPRMAAPLLERAPPEIGWRLGRPAPLAHETPVLASNLPPPRWFGGPCAQAWWRPAGGQRRDPCLWRRPAAADLEAYFADDPFAGWRVPGLPANELADTAPADEPTPWEARATLLANVRAAFARHENALFDASYQWRRETTELAPMLPKLRRRFDILAAGGWQQPVPPREQPFPLLVQLGPADAAAPFVLEGWFSVTKGRYLHFEAHLLLRLGQDGDAALLAEKRRMRAGELHYLDHPALGLLLHATPLEPPDDLVDLAAGLDAQSTALDSGAIGGE